MRSASVSIRGFALTVPNEVTAGVGAQVVYEWAGVATGTTCGINIQDTGCTVPEL